MHEFNTFKHSLRNTSKRDSLLARYLRLVIENIARQGIPVSFHEVTRRSGSGYPAITKAINKWEIDTGLHAVKLKRTEERRVGKMCTYVNISVGGGSLKKKKKKTK